MTDKQRALLRALSPTKEQSNAQLAEAADVSEPYASTVLAGLARLGLAASRYVQDAKDPQTHYRLWKAVKR